MYNDIRDQWRVLTWWLCRVHWSSTLSAQPILGYTNYVLVLENDFENFGRRPHGLIELVCGDDSFLFPTCLPEWLNWPLLQAFLEPISHRDHFGIGMTGFCNGDRLSQRLVQCSNGFFVQVHCISSSFFLSELLQGAQMRANALHTVEVNPESRRVRWSTVFIAGGYTLMASRRYETVAFHVKRELVAGLMRRFPDLVSTNFDLIPVHPSMQAMDPVANLARQRFVLVPVRRTFNTMWSSNWICLPTKGEVPSLSLLSFAKRSWLCKLARTLSVGLPVSFAFATTMDKNFLATRKP